MSGPVTSVAKVEDVQIFLKDPVLIVVILLKYVQFQIHNTKAQKGDIAQGPQILGIILQASITNRTI